MRRAHPGEHLTTLDGVDRALDPDMLMITDTAGTIAVGGVMGGANTEVNDGTTSVLLEAANFNFLSIRRTSQLLKLSSEAGSRFGKRVDPELTVKALARACELLAEVAGGTARPIYGDVYPGKPQPRSIDLDPAYVNRLLGAEIPVEEMVRILEALEFQVDADTGTQGRGEPSPCLPCPRVSVSPSPATARTSDIPADLAEEIGRIYGYDRLTPTLLEDELPPQRRNVALEGEEKVRDILAGAGLDEVITYSMIDVRDEAKLSRGEVPRTRTWRLGGQPRPYVRHRAQPAHRRPRPPAPDAAAEPAEHGAQQPALRRPRRDLRDRPRLHPAAGRSSAGRAAPAGRGDGRPAGGGHVAGA